MPLSATEMQLWSPAMVIATLSPEYLMALSIRLLEYVGEVCSVGFRGIRGRRYPLLLYPCRYSHAAGRRLSPPQMAANGLSRI